MAKPLLVLDEVLAMLSVVGASVALQKKFHAQAEHVLRAKGRMVAAGESDDPQDRVTVASGFGGATSRGFVELTLNDQLTQMDIAKAREIGLMLLEAAEAATSDQIIAQLLRDKIGIDDPDKIGHILLDLRELRQGTRDIRWQTP